MKSIVEMENVWSAFRNSIILTKYTDASLTGKVKAG